MVVRWSARDLVSDAKSNTFTAPKSCFHTPYGVTLFRTPSDRQQLEPERRFHTPYGVTLFRTLPWFTGPGPAEVRPGCTGGRGRGRTCLPGGRLAAVCAGRPVAQVRVSHHDREPPLLGRPGGRTSPAAAAWPCLPRPPPSMPHMDGSCSRTRPAQPGDHADRVTGCRSMPAPAARADAAGVRNHVRPRYDSLRPGRIRSVGAGHRPAGAGPVPCCGWFWRR